MRKALLLLPVFSLLSSHHILLDGENQIQFDHNLSNFKQAIENLESGSQTEVNIVHIGDSHIQADFLTKETRKMFQAQYGNAGRGFVFPYRFAKSWGPLDVKFRTSSLWTHCDVLHPKASCTIGTCGFSIQAQSNATFSISTRKMEVEPAFSKIELWASSAILPSAAAETYSHSQEDKRQFIYLNQASDSIALIASKETTLHGIVLKNERPGVLYHAIGVNGVATNQYQKSQIEEDLPNLNPDLVILSFGTNDSYLSASRFCSNCIVERYKSLINRVKNTTPTANILITAPPSHFRNKQPNNNLLSLNQGLKEMCETEGVAYWDLLTLMGGPEAMREWVKESLARRDYIHFTQKGYALQGQLLFEAIHKTLEK